jgi:hypothetical protein
LSSRFNPISIVNPLSLRDHSGSATLCRSIFVLKSRPGKILLWHGWADGAIMATSSIGYYEGV